MGFILAVGSPVIFEGRTWKVEAFSKGRVTIVHPRRKAAHLDLGALIAAQPQEHRMTSARVLNYTQSFTTYETLNDTVKAAAGDKADHIREAITGFKSGSRSEKLPGEPRDEFNPMVVPQKGRRQAAKAAELAMPVRTFRQWCDDYRVGGEIALTHQSRLQPRVRFPRVDPRLLAEVSSIVGQAGTQTRPVIRHMIDAVLANVPDAKRPSMSTMYRIVDDCQRGTGMRSAIAKTRASMNARPKDRHALRRISYPGEIVQLDTTVLDVFCVNPEDGTAFRPELTVAIDQFTRCVLAMVVARKTNAGHVASLIAEIVEPRFLDPDWPGKPSWPYHGIPFGMQYSVPMEDGTAFGPIVTPETVVVDNGKVFTGKELKRLAAMIGFSLEPTRPGSGFSKGQVERFFGTLSRGALSALRGYTGGGLESTLGDPASQAYFTPTDVLEYLRQWVATIYHVTPQKGLFAPDTEFGNRSPLQMYDIGVNTSGFIRAPLDVNLRYQILPAASRKIGHGPLRINNRRYNAPILQEFAGRTSSLPGGEWLIHWDANDLRTVWLQESEQLFHPIPWTEKATTTRPFSDIARRIVDGQNAQLQPNLQRKELAKDAMRKYNRWASPNVYPPADGGKPKRNVAAQHRAAAVAFTEAAATHAVIEAQQEFEKEAIRPIPPAWGYRSGFRTGEAANDPE